MSFRFDPWIKTTLILSCLGCIPDPNRPLGQAAGPPSAATESPLEARRAESPSAPGAPVSDHAESGFTNTLRTAPDQTMLIPRKTFFGNPERARLRISADGTRVAFLAPRDGVLNIWLAPIDDLPAARPITEDRHRGVRNFFWAYNNRHIIYLQDQDGDEDFHVYSVDLADDRVTDLTPLDGVSARIEAVSELFPNEILVGINDRDGHQLHDIYRVNLLSGERQLLQQNPGFAGFATDHQFRVRFAASYTSAGGLTYLRPDLQGPGGWSPYLEIAPADVMTTGLAGFDKTGDHVYVLDSRERNTAALKIVNLRTGQETLLAENDRADISDVIVHPTEKHAQAVTFTYDRREWQVLDPALQPDLDYLRTVADGEIQITSRTLDDSIWTVAYTMDSGPVRFYLYRRKPRASQFLFTSHPELERLPLVKMHPVLIRSRDGWNLVSYLSLPPGTDPHQTGRPEKPLPLVLNVHGGPWARDNWGYNPVHQLLANRGYAVLSVNYRGSTGFGKEFINAANGQWAGKMHDDLIDAVKWSVDEGVGDAAQIGILGGSYGGYAVLVGLTFTPEVFACGADIVGPSSLVTLLQNPPPYWMPFMPVMKHRVGDHETEAGREFLLSRSPLMFAERITRPLLIAQGAQDPRVKKAEADQIVAAMEEKNIPVTYMLYPEEGHGFARPENRFAFYAVAEAFLAEHLGGRYEPLGDAFEGAVVEFPSGRDQVPGLTRALGP